MKSRTKPSIFTCLSRWQIVQQCSWCMSWRLPQQPTVIDKSSDAQSSDYSITATMEQRDIHAVAVTPICTHAKPHSRRRTDAAANNSNPRKKPRDTHIQRKIRRRSDFIRSKDRHSWTAQCSPDALAKCPELQGVQPTAPARRTASQSHTY